MPDCLVSKIFSLELAIRSMRRIPHSRTLTRDATEVVARRGNRYVRMTKGAFRQRNTRFRRFRLEESRLVSDSCMAQQYQTHAAS